MASVRYLKKEIQHFTSLVLEDCLLLEIAVQEEEKKKQIEEVISDILEKNTSLLKRAGQKKQKKTDYRAIRKELIANTDEVFNRLDKIIK